LFTFASSVIAIVFLGAVEWVLWSWCANSRWTGWSGLPRIPGASWNIPGRIALDQFLIEHGTGWTVAMVSESGGACIKFRTAIFDRISVIAIGQHRTIQNGFSRARTTRGWSGRCRWSGRRMRHTRTSWYILSNLASIQFDIVE